MKYPSSLSFLSLFLLTSFSHGYDPQFTSLEHVYNFRLYDGCFKFYVVELLLCCILSLSKIISLCLKDCQKFCESA